MRPDWLRDLLEEVGHVTYSSASFIERRVAKVSGTNAVLKKVQETLKAAGNKRMFYIPTGKPYPGDA